MADDKRKDIGKEIREWLILIVIGVAAVLAIRNFGFRITAVKGSSMIPNYVHGEYVFTDVFSCKLRGPKRNDIVICEYDDGVDGENFIKRVIACPGDEINIYYNDEEECYRTEVNGETLDEYYINEPMTSCGDREYPLTLGEDEYFVMGDNCNNSEDSRVANIGNIKQTQFVGKIAGRIKSGR